MRSNRNMEISAHCIWLVSCVVWDLRRMIGSAFTSTMGHPFGEWRATPAIQIMRGRGDPSTQTIRAAWERPLGKAFHVMKAYLRTHRDTYQDFLTDGIFQRRQSTN